MAIIRPNGPYRIQKSIQDSSLLPRPLLLRPPRWLLRTCHPGRLGQTPDSQLNMSLSYSPRWVYGRSHGDSKRQNIRVLRRRPSPGTNQRKRLQGMSWELLEGCYSGGFGRGEEPDSAAWKGRPGPLLRVCHPHQPARSGDFFGHGHRFWLQNITLQLA